MRRSLIALAALSIAGLFVSNELIDVHVATKVGGDGDSGFCSASSIFSCTAAARSGASEILGVPIAALGMAFYATFLVLSLLRRLAGDRLRGLDDVFLGGSVVSVAYSLGLAVYSVVALQQLCPLCIVLYTINIGLLAVAVIGHPEPFGAALRRLPRLFATPGLWMAAGVMALSVGAGYAVFDQRAQAAERLARQQPAPPPAAATVEVDPGDSPGKGPKDASVVVVEFSDFECPFCRRLTESLKAAQAEFGDVRIHFRHYPMDNACNPQIPKPFHENACLAAYAVECAERQGRFWPMHDRLFAHSRQLDRESMAEHARAVGIDVEAFLACLDDPGIREAVRRDIEHGTALGVQGTPTFFVNGHRVVGARDPADLVALFRKLAKEKGVAGEGEPGGEGRASTRN